MKTGKKGPKEAVPPSPQFASDPNFAYFKALFEHLQRTYNLQGVELLHAIERKDIYIPVNVFNPTLSGLETVVKFLKENLHLDNKSIAALLHRSEKTIWQAYNASKEKHPELFVLSASQFYIPISLFASRTFSVLETIVVHLKTHYGLSYHAIAEALHRDDRTIWTVHNRAEKKMKGNYVQ
ncbi:hypothetical protein HZB00_02805 [Candidatus Woesearchaeota archaeon]|nr:hypothetical protein [Candidatus Woesearchaeota archaeon]